jgi:hypothetical protein
MARLTIVFVIWIGSTAYALDDADPEYDADLRQAYAAWNEVDASRAAELRLLVDKYERSYYYSPHADRGEDPFSRNQR